MSQQAGNLISISLWETAARPLSAISPHEPRLCVPPLQQVPLANPIMVGLPIPQVGRLVASSAVPVVSARAGASSRRVCKAVQSHARAEELRECDADQTRAGYQKWGVAWLRSISRRGLEDIAHESRIDL